MVIGGATLYFLVGALSLQEGGGRRGPGLLHEKGIVTSGGGAEDRGAFLPLLRLSSRGYDGMGGASGPLPRNSAMNPLMRV